MARTVAIASKTSSATYLLDVNVLIALEGFEVLAAVLAINPHPA